jgi:cation transport regulator
MPYETVEELPPAVRHLPSAYAGDISGCVQSASVSYGADRWRQAREEITFRVAWAAVKKRYPKIGGAWSKNFACDILVVR